MRVKMEVGGCMSCSHMYRYSEVVFLDTGHDCMTLMIS
jgi:hypothetical protein